uniref:Uncharacterized protein n=1 Tax=Orbilia oligospora TaxID=2813651 RepID=A0A6G6A3J7_ORBOL|nr:hypothetical protein [Orbilia oligospora]QID02834.1 hypothetical protein [Orbilia oligospora]QID02876.1 hypothetical protein [Orbilia oligospora]
MLQFNFYVEITFVFIILIILIYIFVKLMWNKPFGFYIFLWCLSFFIRSNILRQVGYENGNLTFDNFLIFFLVLLPWLLMINRLNKELIHNYIIKLLKLIILIIFVRRFGYFEPVLRFRSWT